VFIKQEIDRIVEAFIPELTRVWRVDQSQSQKERQTKAWLRATLQKFADDVVASQRRGAVLARAGKPKPR
jgi:hypothetical protein